MWRHHCLLNHAEPRPPSDFMEVSAWIQNITSPTPHSLSQDLGLEMTDMALDGQKKMWLSWCFQLTRDKPERIYGWLDRQWDRDMGSPSDRWLQRHVVLVCWGPRWGLRHKWLNTKMTYGINGVQENSSPSMLPSLTPEKTFGPNVAFEIFPNNDMKQTCWIKEITTLRRLPCST